MQRIESSVPLGILGPLYTIHRRDKALDRDSNSVRRRCGGLSTMFETIVVLEVVALIILVNDLTGLKGLNVNR